MKTKTSKYIGVHASPRGGWRGQITYKGKRYSVGTYKTEEEAALAREKKAKELGVPKNRRQTIVEVEKKKPTPPPSKITIDSIMNPPSLAPKSVSVSAERAQLLKQEKDIIDLNSKVTRLAKDLDATRMNFGSFRDRVIALEKGFVQSKNKAVSESQMIALRSGYAYMTVDKSVLHCYGAADSPVMVNPETGWVYFGYAANGKHHGGRGKQGAQIVGVVGKIEVISV